MEYKKITAEDIAGKGVVGQADTPLLSALDMQYKVEELPRAVIIPHINSLIDSLNERDAGVDTALSDRYTKQETDTAIARTVTEIGAGDMAKAVYDADGDGVVDNAQKLAGQPAGYYATAQQVAQAQKTAEDAAEMAVPKTVIITETGTDLNDYKEDGIYFFRSATVAPANIPVGTNGWVQVMKGENGAVKQIWHRYGTPGSNDYNTYERTKNVDTGNNGEWGDWVMYMTVKGGTMEGNIIARKANVAGDYVRNISVKSNGTNVSTASVYFTRE